MKTYTKPTILVVAINAEDMIALSMTVNGSSTMSPDGALSKQVDSWQSEEEDL